MFKEPLQCLCVSSRVYEGETSFSSTNPSKAHHATATLWIGKSVSMCSVGRPKFAGRLGPMGECRRHDPGRTRALHSLGGGADGQRLFAMPWDSGTATERSTQRIWQGSKSLQHTIAILSVD